MQYQFAEWARGNKKAMIDYAKNFLGVGTHNPKYRGVALTIVVDKDFNVEITEC